MLPVLCPCHLMVLCLRFFEPLMELAAFAKKYRIRDILQYVCGGTTLMPPGRFANFVNQIGEGSGATVTAMFDRTRWKSDTSPYSIVAKLEWYKAVRSILIGTYNNHYSLAGVTFGLCEHT